MIIEARGDVIKLKGALVENQWTALKSAVTLLLVDHPRGVIMDGSGLTEVSEAGAHTFLDASSFIQAQNARVVVAGLSEDILTRIRKFPGVRSQLVVASTVDEARASLESGGVAVARGKRAVPVVLVPLIGLWRRAVQFAAVEAASRRAELHLLYMLEIPRTLPLGVPMPDMEQKARDTLTEAEKALKRRGVKVRRLTIRTRDIVEGVAKYAGETKPDLLVVAYSKADMAREAGRFTAIDTFCHDAPCDVAIYCVAE
ncbi:MAG TPA: universal stress protein [Armatimonadota bacterium]|nr:universal stress protein [Armatimonadota bacterium]